CVRHEEARWAASRNCVSLLSGVPTMTARSGSAPTRIGRGRRPARILALATIALGAMAVTVALAADPSGNCDSTLSAQDAQSVRGVMGAHRPVWLRGDAKGVLATFTDDAVLLPAHGAAPVAGTSAITQYWWPAGAPPTTITRLEITMEHLAGDCHIAYVSGH